MFVLFKLHSIVRFLVLASAALAILFYAFGVLRRAPVTKAVRIFGSVFVGFLDLQILIGIALVISGRWYPALVGHLVMMLIAAAVAHVLLARNRRKPSPGYTLPLVGVAIALVFIIGGTLAIGRGIFTVTAF